MGSKQRRVARPFICSVCGKRFHASWELAQHAKFQAHYARTKRKPVTATKKGAQPNDKEETTVAYAVGYTHSFITDLSRRSGIPYGTIANRLGAILRDAEVR